MADFMKSAFVKACENTLTREHELLGMFIYAPIVQGTCRLPAEVIPWLTEKLCLDLEDQIRRVE